MIYNKFFPLSDFQLTSTVIVTIVTVVTVQRRPLCFCISAFHSIHQSTCFFQ